MTDLWITSFYINLNVKYSITYMMFILSLNVYQFLIISLISMNKHSMLKSMRMISLMISFQILMFLVMFNMMYLIEGLKLLFMLYYQFNIKFLLYYFYFLYPLYLMFIIWLLIDLNRILLDLIDGESKMLTWWN